MGIQPSEALNLTLWEYTGILHHHNAGHDVDDEVDAPDEHDMLLAFAHAERMGFGRMVH